jgi:hypothetical protein
LITGELAMPIGPADASPAKVVAAAAAHRAAVTPVLNVARMSNSLFIFETRRTSLASPRAAYEREARNSQWPTLSVAVIRSARAGVTTNSGDANDASDDNDASDGSSDNDGSSDSDDSNDSGDGSSNDAIYDNNAGDNNSATKPSQYG